MVPTGLYVSDVNIVRHKLDLTTGDNVAGFTPMNGGQNRFMLLSSDYATLYMGGNGFLFEPDDGDGGTTEESRFGFHSVDAATGSSFTAFDPAPNSGGGTPSPESVFHGVRNGTTVYFGGAFNNIAGTDRRRVAKFNNEALDATFDPPSTLGTVRALALLDNVLFAAGDFSTGGGAPYNVLVALNATTGALLAWDAQISQTSFGTSSNFWSNPAKNAIYYAPNVEDFDVLGTTQDYYVGIDVTTLLPVELVSFSGRLDGGRAVLRWETASETNNAGFEVERSDDGAAFRNVGYVSGRGTTAEAQRYTFADPEPVFHRATYRLRQVDYDGAFAYSPLVEVGGETPARFVLGQNYPNPFNPQTMIPYHLPVATRVRLDVVDLLGRTVMTLVDGVEEAGVHRVTLDATRLPSGVYSYRLHTPDGTQVRPMFLLR